MRATVFAVIKVLAIACLSTQTDALRSTENETIVLHLLPHSHADVGWLQTVNSLSRVNVSRILNGVVGNLANDTKKRRRFVWDEMAFLEMWWKNQATDAQRKMFKTLVREGRIEMVDNGWSQHDMGCTTLQSQINNWVQGHEWIRKNLGAEFQPNVGWSIDPFGMSSSQAVFQAQMGMSAWFFTRVSGSVVDTMKREKSLEFVWRGSSSLSNASSEIFSHVFESYYCMPLPTYSFEWGPDKGAVIPNATNILSLSQNLADIAKDRSKWFRTPNVLIPWGCDYQYQNAELMYRATDWLIDTINNHTHEWGVRVQYSTPSEYLAAVHSFATSSAAVSFPVKANGSSFFPFEDWSGYFTSRPYLKKLSSVAHAALRGAEQTYARDVISRSYESWKDMETARRNAAIFQHHDAITGTFCVAEEGCSGVDQVIGSHDILGNYESMLTASIEASNRVIASSVANATLSTDPISLGNILMGQGDGGERATLLVYNPTSFVRTEGISVQVPICDIVVRERADDGKLSEVTSQVGTLYDVNNGQHPFYDFELSFLAIDLPPFGFKTYVLDPSPARTCHGGNVRDVHHFTASAPSREEGNSGEHCLQGRIQNIASERIREKWQTSPTKMMGTASEYWASVTSETERVERERSCKTHARVNDDSDIVLENAFLSVSVNKTFGLQSVTHKSTGRRFDVKHELMRYASSETLDMPAYAMAVDGEATSVLVNGTVRESVSSIGAVMQEVKLQVSKQHKTRIRIWTTTDNDLGHRIEFAHRIGVLNESQEILSRFTLSLDDDEDSTRLYTEDNGYERIVHDKMSKDDGVDPQDIGRNVYPAQESAWIESARTNATVSVALERSHGIASLSRGTLDVMQHRRQVPYFGSGGPVVLDDADRIFTQTWIAVGDAASANRMRISNKIRLNNPPMLLFGPLSAAYAQPRCARTVQDIVPYPLIVSMVRAADEDSTEFVVQIMHLFSSLGESDVESYTDSIVVSDVEQTLRQTLCISNTTNIEYTEATLDGVRNLTTAMDKRFRFPADDDEDIAADRSRIRSMLRIVADRNESAEKKIIVRPYEIRTFRVRVVGP